jgi:uncharacterized membrane protein
MESHAKAAGHAIHPMLVVFPLGLLTTAVVFDVLYLVTDRAGFAVAAGYAIAAGVVGGVLAALFGMIDYAAIPPGTRAKRVGRVHGIGNMIVLALFAVSFVLRVGANGWHPTGWALLFSFVGVVLAGVTSWLGGELVGRLGIGVDRDADVNAPSSLSRAGAHGRPAPTR